MKNDILKFFIETALERHRIYVKKEAGEDRPWTDNDIYQKFFFCNVFRQYDKCSKWIIENIIPYERWDMLILYRFISTYSLFEKIKDTCELDDFKSIYKLMESNYREGVKNFSACFIRNPLTSKGKDNTYKAPFILIEDMRKAEFEKCSVPGDFLESIEDMVNYLKQFAGIGGFMGYEYACDFEYTKFFNPTDKYTWANMGPGAQQGLSLLMYGERRKRFKEIEWLQCIQEIYKPFKEAFNKEFPDEDVSMREIEHWLCEFQKYIKYRNTLSQGIKCKYRKY